MAIFHKWYVIIYYVIKCCTIMVKTKNHSISWNLGEEKCLKRGASEDCDLPWKHGLPCCEGLVCKPFGELGIGKCFKEDSGNIHCTLRNMFNMYSNCVGQSYIPFHIPIIHLFVTNIIINFYFPLFAEPDWPGRNGVMEQ